MLVFPAMELFEHKVVRLYNGDCSNLITLSFDPMEIANDFELQGASYMHLIDIEGAKMGRTTNLEYCRKIKQNTGLKVQVGGGIRNMTFVKRYIDSGADRVVLGTAAAENEEMLKEAVALYGDKIAAAIDIKDGFVVTHGRTKKTDIEAEEFALKMQNMGVSTIVCTDISKDDTLSSVDGDLYERLSGAVKMNIIAAGGINSLNDVLTMRDLNLHGVIVNRAYYDGAIYIKEAIRITR